MSRSSSPGRRPVADRRHVADHQVDERVDRLERQGLDVFRLIHPQGRNLDLDQVVEAGLHVDPVVEVGEAGRRRRHDQRVGHVLDRGAAQPRLLAVDVDLDGRVVELLLELDVAEEGDPPHLARRSYPRAAGPGRDRCRRSGPRSASSEPKLMTLVTISPGSKPKVALSACRQRLLRGQSSLLEPLGQPRDHPLGQDLAEPLAKLGELDPALLAEGDAQLAVVRPAHEEHHVVDAEVRGDLARRNPSRSAMFSGFASRSISSRHFTAICRVSS